jgi:hypothetical protein
MEDLMSATKTAASAALSRAETARRRGVAFVLSQIGPDGEVERTEPRVTYYRLPWALAVSGETEAAHRVLSWIERNALGDDGAFHGGISWNPAANARFNTYPETCLAYGAWLLRRFDIANRCMDFARTGFDAQTGGVFMDRAAMDETGGQLVFLTCQYGMSAAITGRTEDALQVANWFANLRAAQPDWPDRFYTMWNRRNGLVTGLPDGPDRKHVVQEAQDERQYHYNGGMAAACLNHVAMVTGGAHWIDLAREFQSFSINSTPLQFNTRQVCKSAWGSGLLTLATGSNDYEPWLIKMANWFAGLQEDDGSWTNTPYLDPNPPDVRRTEVTAEFIVHLDTLIAALSTIDARG